MKRILVTGLKSPAGGVESVVNAFIEGFDPDALSVDLAVYGETDAFADTVIARGGNLWQLPSRVRHPFKHAKVLAEIFKKNRYDAVWCHVSGLTNLSVLKAATAAEVKKRVVHAHTSDFAWGTPLMRFLVPLMHRNNQRVLTRYATHLWSCSDNVSAFMFGKQPSMMVNMVPNAIDVDKFLFDASTREKVRAEYGFQDNPVLVHVGRMCTAKNQQFLLDIFAAVLDTHPQARLLFVGDGELREQIKTYADMLGVTPSVAFTGALPDTSEILSAGDAFLLPSLTEGFPVTVMEAQANGLPCVVSLQAVPQAVNVSGQVLFVSLEHSTEEWAQTVLSCCGNRFDATAQIKQAGYDSRLVALRIQQFFCEGVEL